MRVRSGTCTAGRTRVRTARATAAHIAVATSALTTGSALAATRAAMPLLRMAETVHVVVIDPPMHGPNRSVIEGRCEGGQVASLHVSPVAMAGRVAVLGCGPAGVSRKGE